MTICPKCQTQNAPGTTYCVGCGQPLPGRAARRMDGGPGGPGGPGGQGQKTGMAITSLVLGILGLPTLGCLLVGAIVAIVLGAMAYSRANKEPDVYGGKGMAMAGIILGGVSLLIGIIGVIAAIAIPSLLRARVSTNEATAIGDTRTVVSAETAYQAANAGFYDTLECLGGPARCIPGYSGPTMLEGQLAVDNGHKAGYRHTLHLGPTPARVPPVASPSSVTSFAYVSVPITQGQTGMRAFCADETGVIRVWTDGQVPEIEDGHCPASGRVLQ